METNIVTSIVIEGNLHTVFKNFVHRFSDWWPKAYTWSGSEDLSFLSLGLKAGDWAIEKGRDGFMVTWARTTFIDEDHQISFAWHIGPNRDPQPNPAQASLVDIAFTEKNDGKGEILIILTHHQFDHHGQGHEAYREQLANEMYGWPFILKEFKKFNDHSQ